MQGIAKAVLVGATVGMLFAPTSIANAADTAPTVSVSGTLEVAHTDNFAQGESSVEYSLDRGTRIELLQPNSALRSLPDGAQVTLKGKRQRSRLVVSSATETTKTARFAPRSAAQRKVAVIVVRFADAQPTADQPTIRSAIFGTASDYLAEQSNGEVTLSGIDDPSGDIFGPYTVPQANPNSSESCQPDYWADQADAKAVAAHGSLGGYDHVVYLLPSTNCGFAGRAEVSGLDRVGTRTWLNGTLSQRVVGHELGHNLGLPHASTSRCTKSGTRVSIGGVCTSSEYGDPFDTMGASTRHYGGWGKGRLAQRGIFPALQTQTVSSAGTYPLNPSVLGGPGTQALRIPRPGTPYSLFLEIRKPTGVWDIDDRVSTQGVSIRQARDYSDATYPVEWTKLLDATPATNTFEDAPLPAGQSFYDPSDGLLITNLAVADGVASVQVRYGAPAPLATPERLKGRANIRYGIKLRWKRVRAATGYVVYRDGVELTRVVKSKHIDTGMSSGSLHRYNVAAIGADDAISAQSAPVYLLPAG